MLQLIAMAAGVRLSVCVPPVIVVRAEEKEFELAFGVTVSIHVDPAGVMAEFDGTDWLYVPLPLSEPEMLGVSVPPLHVYGPVGYWGFGWNVNV